MFALDFSTCITPTGWWISRSTMRTRRGKTMKMWFLAQAWKSVWMQSPNGVGLPSDPPGPFPPPSFMVTSSSILLLTFCIRCIEAEAFSPRVAPPVSFPVPPPTPLEQAFKIPSCKCPTLVGCLLILKSSTKTMEVGLLNRGGYAQGSTFTKLWHQLVEPAYFMVRWFWGSILTSGPNLYKFTIYIQVQFQNSIFFSVLPGLDSTWNWQKIT